MSRPRGRGGNGKAGSAPFGKGPGRSGGGSIFGGTKPPSGIRPNTTSGCGAVAIPALLTLLALVWWLL